MFMIILPPLGTRSKVWDQWDTIYELGQTDMGHKRRTVKGKMYKLFSISEYVIYKKENNVTWRWPSEVETCCRYILIF
jgi:hypothetical protein